MANVEMGNSAWGWGGGGGILKILIGGGVCKKIDPGANMIEAEVCWGDGVSMRVESGYRSLHLTILC